MMDMVQLLKAPQAGFEAEDDFEAVNAVSYTHLTLPTNREV